MEGLAQSMAQPAGDAGAGVSVEQVIQLLMQGADPDELVQKGVPPELIMQAIQVIEQQMAAQAAPEQGLAAQSVGGM